MSPDDILAEFQPARESVQWAEDAINELRGSATIVLQRGAAEIVTEIDPQSGDKVQKVRFTQEIPSLLRRKTTDALTTTRHAFDQATFAARSCTSGRSNKPIFYPWAQDPTDLDKLLQNKRIDQRLWSVFKAHEPYQ